MFFLVTHIYIITYDFNFIFNKIHTNLHNNLLPNLSPLFDCINLWKAFHTQLLFMTLTLGLGCFPLELLPYRNSSVCINF
jgi:hypothetical protein